MTKPNTRRKRPARNGHAVPPSPSTLEQFSDCPPRLQQYLSALAARLGKSDDEIFNYWTLICKVVDDANDARARLAAAAPSLLTASRLSFIAFSRQRGSKRDGWTEEDQQAYDSLAGALALVEGRKG